MSSGAVNSTNCNTVRDTISSMSQARASSSINKSSNSRLSLLLRSKTHKVHSHISSGIARNRRQQDGDKSCRPSDKARDTKNTQRSRKETIKTWETWLKPLMSPKRKSKMIIMKKFQEMSPCPSKTIISYTQSQRPCRFLYWATRIQTCASRSDPSGTNSRRNQ